MADKFTYLKFTAGPSPRPDLLPKNARRISSEVLFAGQDEIVLDHNGRYYLLRKQRLGGLVLTGLDDINLQ